MSLVHQNQLSLLEEKINYILQKSNDQQTIITNLTTRIHSLENPTSCQEENHPPSIQEQHHQNKVRKFIPAIPMDIDGNTQLNEKSITRTTATGLGGCSHS